MQKYELYVGIDMSRQWLDVRPTRNGEVRDMPHRRFNNDVQGFTRMDSWLEDYSRQQGIGGLWLFCMEHTGVYTLPLCSHLQQQGRDVVLESPLHLVQSLGIRRGKNDKADAGDIARYACLHGEELSPRPMCSGILLRIQALLSYRSRLERYSNGQAVASKEGEAFAPTDARGSLRAHSKEAEKHLNQKVKEVEKLIRQGIKNDEDLSEKFRLLTSVKGAGLIIGSYMLFYTNGFTAFDNARKFACYAGLAPFGKQSGTTLKVLAKVSHLANKRIKALLSCGAQSAIQHDPDIRAYYQCRLDEGYDKNKLLNVVKNKLVRRMFAVMKRGTPMSGYTRVSNREKIKYTSQKCKPLVFSTLLNLNLTFVFELLLKTFRLLLFFFFPLQCAVAQKLQLAPAQTPSTRLIVNREAAISFDFRLAGSVIRYTLDGSEPDGSSPVYQHPVRVLNSAAIKAKVFKEGFLPSETLTVFVMAAKAAGIDSIALLPRPEKYVANGWPSLCDGRLGDNDFGKNWLGFNQPEVTLHCFFNKKKKLRQLSLGLMQQQGSWIFLPKTVEVFDEKGKLLARYMVPDAGEERPASMEIIAIPLPRKRYGQLTLRLEALPGIPDWHSGKGQTGWMFVDEVMFN